jgi:hypothetical protein
LQEDVVDHEHAWTVSELTSSDSRIATAVEGRFVTDRGKQHPPSETCWKEAGSQ